MSNTNEYSMRRIQREITHFRNNPIENIEFEVDPYNSYVIQGNLISNVNSKFGGIKLPFRLEFPNDYPFRQPNIKFLEPDIIQHHVVKENGDVVFHCNCEECNYELTKGEFSKHPILEHSPAMSFFHYLLTILALISEYETEPMPDDKPS